MVQRVTKEDLEQLIEEAREAGKDTSKLEAALASLEAAGLHEAAAVGDTAPPAGEKRQVQTERGTVVIESTGPAREEDFE